MVKRVESADLQIGADDNAILAGKAGEGGGARMRREWGGK